MGLVALTTGVARGGPIADWGKMRLMGGGCGIFDSLTLGDLSFIAQNDMFPVSR
jgi:hypothetical protein